MILKYEIHVFKLRIETNVNDLRSVLALLVSRNEKGLNRDSNPDLCSDT